MKDREAASYELGSDFAGLSDRVQAWTTFESTLLHSQAASERLIRAVVGQLLAGRRSARGRRDE